MTTALSTAAKISAIRKELQNKFVDREDYLHALSVALVSGEHLLSFGPTGTAKSDVVINLAERLQVPTFRILLNPDTTREDLVGPIDPAALRDGRWERKWAGLATATVAFVDEVGRASSQVQNMLLDAMEERRLSTPYGDRDLDLHVVIGASNSMLDKSVEAVANRFGLWVVVPYLASAGAVTEMLRRTFRTIAGSSNPVSPNELRECRQTCRSMAASAPDEVIEKLVEMWSSHSSVGSYRVSDRRWRAVLICAGAEALLNGRTEISVEDLSVARWMLWTKPDEQETITKWVMDLTQRELGELHAAQALVAELVQQAAKIPAMGLDERAALLVRANRLRAKINRTSTGSYTREWKRLLDTLDDVIAKASEV